MKANKRPSDKVANKQETFLYCQFFFLLETSLRAGEEVSSCTVAVRFLEKS